MLRSEIYRNLIKKKNIIVILFFILIKLMVTFFINDSVENLDRNIERNKRIYIEFVEEFSGKIDQEKAFELQEFYNYLIWCDEEFSRLSNGNLQGEISNEEINNFLKENEQYYKFKSIKNIIFKDIDYVSQDYENREIIYENGWVGLIGNDSMDWILVVLVIVISTIYLGDEYENNMHEILITTQKGRKHILGCRIANLVIVSFVSLFVMKIIDVCGVMYKYGITRPFASASTVKLFCNLNPRYSLLDIFVIESLTEFLGCIFIILFINCLMTFVKRQIPVVSIALISIYLPVMFLEDEIIFRLPWISNFMKSDNLIVGFDYTGIGFEKVDRLGEIYTFLVAIIFLFILLIVSYLAYYDGSFFSFKSIKKRINIFVAVVTCSLILNGCTEKEYGYRDDSFYGNKVCEYDGNIIFISSYDIIDVNTKESLLIEPFDNNTYRWNYKYIDGVAYYIDGNTIACVNFNDYTSENVYPKRVNYDENLFLIDNFSDEMIDGIEDFFVYKEKLFVKKNDWYMYNMESFKEIFFCNSLDMKEYALYNRKLFYSNYIGEIKIYDFETEKIDSLNDICGDILCVTDNGIYYKSIGDSHIYCRKNDGQLVEIIDCEVETLCIDNNIICYSLYGGEILCCDVYGENKESIQNVGKDILYIGYRENTVYYYVYDEGIYFIEIQN